MLELFLSSGGAKLACGVEAWCGDKALSKEDIQGEQINSLLGFTGGKLVGQ